MRYGELKKLLKKSKCHKVKEGSSHEWWYSPITDEHFPVGRHDNEEVKKERCKAF